MRRIVNQKFIIVTTLLALALFFVIPQTSHANSFFDIASGLLDAASGGADFYYGLFGQLLYYVLATPLAFILSLSGNIMDIAITLSLSATNLFNSTAVSIGWKAVRDIFNMFFIFSLIYISIQTIIGAGGYKTSEALKKVIISAVIINFSLYFTKIAIDVSNIFAVWIYNGIQGITPGSNSISQTIQDIFSVEKMFKTKKVNDLSAFAAVIVLCFLYLASIKVFLEISFLFITRTVMFVFLLILSPIGFVGEVFPKLATESDRWKKDLIGQALVAPVFLLLLYITLLFIDNVQKSTLLSAGGIDPDKITYSSFTFADYVIFILMYLMIKKSLDITKEFAGKSGEVITGAIKGGLGIALGAVSGGAAMLGRRVIGGAAASLAQNAAINNAAAGKVGGNAFTKFTSQIAGKAALGAARGTASSNFDVRSTGALKGLGFETKAFGVDMSKTQKGGFKQAVKDREEKEKKYAEEFGDSNEGIDRRMAYADSRKGSFLTRLAIGDKARGKMADKIRVDTGLAFGKAETEESKKEAQKIKNQMIDEQIAIERFKKATKSDNISQINNTLQTEQQRVNSLATKFREDKNNKIGYILYKINNETDTVRSSSSTPKEQSEAEMRISKLREEYNEAVKNMSETERKKLTDPKEGKVPEIKDFENYFKEHDAKLKEAVEEEILSAKKEMIEKINKNITEKRIGKPDKYKNGERTEEGIGLAKKLAEKKREAEQKKREQDILDGKTPKGKPTDGPKDPQTSPEEEGDQAH